jgi:LPXTG-motif cell wall-anchored protein
MNKRIKILLSTLVLFLGLQLTVFAPPPPPPPSGGHSQTGNQDGGGAPLGGGFEILLVLAAGYSFRKYKKMNK